MSETLDLIGGILGLVSKEDAMKHFNLVEKANDESCHEFDTTFDVNDEEYPATVRFVYEPEALETDDSPGDVEIITIIGCMVTIGTKTRNFFTEEYDWLLTEAILRELESNARVYLKENEQYDLELKAGI